MRTRLSQASVALLLLGCAAGLGAHVVQAEPPAEQTAFNRRTKDMEVLEGLLEESVQTAISTRVQESQRLAFANVVNAVDLPQGATVDASWVLRMGGTSRAHGLFLDGYGLMFSLQIPPVSVLPHTIALTLGSGPLKISSAQGRLALLPPAAPQDEAAIRRVAVGAVAWRARQLQQQILEMRDLMERDAELGEEAAADLEALKTEFEALSARLAKMNAAELAGSGASPRTVGVVPEAEIAVIDPDAGTLQDPQAERTFMLVRDAWTRTVNEYAHWTERAETERREVSTVVVEAVIDTLAQYGTLLHGLGPADRISVVVLPADDVTFLRLHRPERRDEFVVSVRFRDVIELDDGTIDFEEFRQRAGIHSRLGIAMPLPAREPAPEDEAQQQ